MRTSMAAVAACVCSRDLPGTSTLPPLTHPSCQQTMNTLMPPALASRRMYMTSASSERADNLPTLYPLSPAMYRLLVQRTLHIAISAACRRSRWQDSKISSKPYLGLWTWPGIWTSPSPSPRQRRVITMTYNKMPFHDSDATMALGVR